MAKTARNASARSRASEDATDVTFSNPGNLAWLRAAWVLAAGALTLVVLALASFHSADPPTTAVAIPNSPPLNLCGKFGAAIAHLLYEVFGVGVWVPVCYLGTLLAFTTVCIGVLVLRYTQPALKRPFRVRAPWLVCIGGALICSAMMVSLPHDTWLRLGIWTAIGFLIYVFYGFRNSALRQGGH